MSDCADYDEDKCGPCPEYGGTEEAGCYKPINRKKANGSKVPCSAGLSDIDPYSLECLAMAIVNHVNERTGVDVKKRQETNDENFDHVIKQVKTFLKEIGR